MFTVNVSITAATANAGVKECVEACPADKCCIAEMEKSGSSVTCKHARLEIAMAMYVQDTARMFYKVPPSQIAAASLDAAKKDAVKSKTMGSGLYAVCDITDWLSATQSGLVGTSANPALVEAGRDAIEWNTPQCDSIDSCKAACTANAACWGFVLTTHPTNGGPAFALRGGESWLGGRSFFASPDGKIAPNELIGMWATFSS
uniref:Uncharacterized protein n=1 Tax=Tetradesmus obliquus TaxID=3088 RepID=A0A383W7K7_TETOB|eukprot:jgi/Sobl393_1/2049/SZX73421.1